MCRESHPGKSSLREEQEAECGCGGKAGRGGGGAPGWASVETAARTGLGLSHQLQHRVGPPVAPAGMGCASAHGFTSLEKVAAAAAPLLRSGGL